MNDIRWPLHLRIAGLFLLCISFSGLLRAAALISYSQSIQPIFEQKCVACHACNDAPCQLNLGSGEGLLRGATKVKVYDSTRTRPQPPTRLFIDAQSALEWRAKGFASVLGESGH